MICTFKHTINYRYLRRQIPTKRLHGNVAWLPVARSSCRPDPVPDGEGSPLPMQLEDLLPPPLLLRIVRLLLPLPGSTSSEPRKYR
jgi:hypothetical protein